MLSLTLDPALGSRPSRVPRRTRPFDPPRRNPVLFNGDRLFPDATSTPVRSHFSGNNRRELATTEQVATAPPVTPPAKGQRRPAPAPIVANDPPAPSDVFGPIVKVVSKTTVKPTSKPRIVTSDMPTKPVNKTGRRVVSSADKKAILQQFDNAEKALRNTLASIDRLGNRLDKLSAEQNTLQLHSLAKAGSPKKASRAKTSPQPSPAPAPQPGSTITQHRTGLLPLAAAKPNAQHNATRCLAWIADQRTIPPGLMEPA